MSGVIRSLARFSWAMSLFGARQAAELLTAAATARAPRRATSSFDAVAAAAEKRLGGGFRDLQDTGGRWQQGMVDLAFRALDPAVDVSREVTSRTLVRGTLVALKQSAGLMKVAIPVGDGAPWQELRNKLEAFESFQYVASILGFRPASFAPGSGGGRGAAALLRRIDQAAGKGSYPKLWLTEGLGFTFAEAAWNGAAPRDLLRCAALERLPEDSLIPLHTGMGLSLARRVLPDLDAGDAVRAGVALERLWRWCERNARDGFALASWEAVGLIACQLAAEVAPLVDGALSGDGAAERREAFWHGFGRGLYFTATQTLPGSTGRAVDKARAEAPAGAPRLNALSGLAWAVTLVNFRHPEVLESYLEGRAFDAGERDAVGAGVAAAALLWLDAAGEEAHWRAFRRHRPAPASVERWRRMVTSPVDAAVAGWDQVKAGPGPGSIFRYRRG